MKAYTKTGHFISLNPNWVLILFLAILFASLKTQAQTAKNFATKQPFLFEENKGQLMDQSGNALSDVKYYGKDGGVYVYCKEGMLSFVFTKTEKEPGQISEATGQQVSDVGVQNIEPLHRKQPEKANVSTSRMDLVLINSNPNTQITATEQQEYYENFYTTGNADHGITNVHTYKTLTYKDIYPNIDMILNIAKKGMEYSFLVHPGGNVSDIKLQWNGAEKEEALKNGGIKYANMLGSMEESAPKSFAEGKLVGSKFIKYNSGYGFKVESYNRNRDLIIDPTLVWGTYYGDYIEFGSGVKTDRSGNVYLTGITGMSNRIASSGAYQTSFGGDADAFLAKFSTSGTRLWGSYFGGAGYDSATALCVDTSGNIFMVGQTNSPNGIATSGTFQTSLTGSFEGFLSKFSASGKLFWASYSSGNRNTNVLAVATDLSGNVFITGNTTSDSDIATSGAYQTFYAGSLSYPYLFSDAFVAKFNGSGSKLWGTYFGGRYNNIGYGICTDTLGNAYITGSTNSDSGIASAGAYRTSFAGGQKRDAFLAKFSSSGKKLWATYYGGSGDDVGEAISSDNSGNVYITGSTQSDTGIATKGAYQTSNKGYSNNTYNAFLAKFNSKGSLGWATYYGGSWGENGFGICTDASASIYLIGITRSDSGIATSGAYLTSNPVGSGKTYLAKFNSSGNLNWGTYYGGTCQNWGYSSSSDNLGNVYISGGTCSSSGIATSGAYEGSNGGGTQSAFLAKFNFYQPNVAVTALISPTNPACPGYVPVKVTLKDTGNTNITSATIAWAWNGVRQSPDVTWTGSLKPTGTTTVSLGIVTLNTKFSKLYTIKAWPTTANGTTNAGGYGDTLSTSIIVDSLPSPSAGTNASICPGSSTSIGSAATSGNTYSWTSKPSGFTSTSSNPTVSPTAKTIYYLAEKNVSGCSAKDSVVVTINPLPSATAGGKITACLGAITGSIKIGASPVTGHTYSWTSNPSGFTSTISDPAVSPSVTTTYYLTETIIATGCSAQDSAVYTIVPMAAANAGKNSTICAGSSVNIGAPKVTGSTYTWVSTPPGFTSTSSSPTVSPAKTTSYTVIETNTSGCTNSNSVTITVASGSNAGFAYSETCPGDSTFFTNTNASSSAYIWSFGDGKTSTAKNPAHLYSGIGSYNVTLKDSNGGCYDSVSKTVTISKCVWPGDANFDKVDNIYDILAIGLAYNDTGSKRTDTTTQWYAHPCTDWSKNFSSGANHKHADCNGDGKVDLQDVVAIFKNYSQTHSKSGGSFASGNPADPALSLSIAKDSIYTGDTLSVQMNLGTSSKSVSNIYGICFGITYDPMNVNQSKGITADFSKCWLGTPNKDLIYLVFNDTVNSVLDIGLVRTDHSNISGYGQIGALTIILPDNVGGKREVKTELRFGIENVKAINFAETDISLYTLGDSVLFYGYKNGIESANKNLNKVRVYPNPTHSVLHLDAGQDLISGITVSNILGEKILNQKYTNLPQADLNIEQLAPGAYFIDIQTANGIARSRFVKN